MKINEMIQRAIDEKNAIFTEALYARLTTVEEELSDIFFRISQNLYIKKTDPKYPSFIKFS